MEFPLHLRILTIADHYCDSQSMRICQKDGALARDVLCLVLLRLRHLIQEVSFVCPRLERQVFYLNFLVPGVMLAPLFFTTSTLSKTYKWLEPLESLEKKIEPWADTLMNVVCSVAYVGLVMLGFVQEGSIGLIGQILIAANKKAWIPAKIDRCLIPSLRLISSAIDLKNEFSGSKSFILWKLVACFSFINRVTDLIALNFDVSSLASSLRHPFRGLHSPKALPDSWVDVKKTIEDSTVSWEVDRYHIFSDHLTNVLPDAPVDFFENTARYFSPLFEKIDEHIRTHPKGKQNISELKNLKEAVIEGYFTDRAPVNLPRFCLLLYSYLQGIDKEVDLEKKSSAICDLIKLSQQCPAAWIADIQSYLIPDDQKNDRAVWALHFELAKFRTAVVQHFIPTHSNDFGGSNGVHFQDSLHLLLRPWFRTYKGECLDQLEEDRLVSLWDHFFERQYSLQCNGLVAPSRKMSSLKQFLFDFGFSNRCNRLMGAGFSILSFQKVVKSIPFEEYFSFNFIQHYAEALIEAKLVQAGNAFEIRRRIPWKFTLDWVVEFQKKFPGKDSFEIYDTLVGTDSMDEPCLTPAGIRSFLWSVGIIRPRKSGEGNSDQNIISSANSKNIHLTKDLVDQWLELGL